MLAHERGWLLRGWEGDETEQVCAVRDSFPDAISAVLGGLWCASGAAHGCACLPVCHG